MTYKVLDNIEIENARIMFKNFSGNETQYNREGERNFCVVIPDAEMAEKLANDGWAIRILAPREEGDEPMHYMNVKVSYKNIPPSVYLVTEKADGSIKKTLLNEDTIGILDHAELRTVDLVIRPYNWSVSGKSGVKAYLKDGYFVNVEDKFAAKYAEEEYGEEVSF